MSRIKAYAEDQKDMSRQENINNRREHNKRERDTLTDGHRKKPRQLNTSKEPVLNRIKSLSDAAILFAE